MQEGSGMETSNVISVLYLFAVKNKGTETGLGFYWISKIKFYVWTLCINSKDLFKKIMLYLRIESDVNTMILDRLFLQN